MSSFHTAIFDSYMDECKEQFISQFCVKMPLLGKDRVKAFPVLIIDVMLDAYFNGIGNVAPDRISDDASAYFVRRNLKAGYEAYARFRPTVCQSLRQSRNDSRIWSRAHELYKPLNDGMDEDDAATLGALEVAAYTACQTYGANILPYNFGPIENARLYCFLCDALKLFCNLTMKENQLRDSGKL